MRSQHIQKKRLFAREYHLINERGIILAYDVENVRLIRLNQLEGSVLEDVREKPASVYEIHKKLPTDSPEKVADAVEELKRVNLLGDTPLKKSTADQVEEYERMQLEKLTRKKLMQVSLNVTHKCNLNCDYCYGGDGSYGGPAVNMSRKTARRAIDFLMGENGSSDRCRITLFGGEPLLNFDLVKYVVRHAKQEASRRRKKIDFGMTTNGVLLDDDKIEFIIKENIEVTFSFDGPRSIHDRNRPLKSSKVRSSYDLIHPKILKFIEKAERENCFYGFRATLTRPGIRNIEDVINFFGNFNTRRITYDTAEYKNGYSPGGLAISHDDLVIYKAKVREMAARYTGNRSKSDLDLFSGPLKVLQNHTRRHNSCISPGILYVGVSADGDIFPCHRFVGCKDSRLGTVWEGFDRERWLKRYVKTHIYSSRVCTSCWIRYYCGGLCPATNYFLGGDMSLSESVKPEPVHCRLKKIVFEEALRLYYRLSCADSPGRESENHGGQ